MSGERRITPAICLALLSVLFTACGSAVSTSKTATPISASLDAPAVTHSPTVAGQLAPTPTLTFEQRGEIERQEPLPSPEPIDEADEEEANLVLQRFLGSLASRDYETAVSLYGGTYILLWNRTDWRFSLEDRVGVWRETCELRLLQCLPVSNIRSGEHTPTSFEFFVAFSNPDGTTFTLGPCCGATATEQPPVSEFLYSVIESRGQFLVMGTPPYAP